MPRPRMRAASECPHNRQIAAYFLGIAESPSPNPRQTQRRPPGAADGTILVNDGWKAAAIHGVGTSGGRFATWTQEGFR